jgi:hypothetical protein
VLTLGKAFIWDGHVWFVLSKTDIASGRVLCVNITSFYGGCGDDECILEHCDYSWIHENYKSVVAFSRARLWDAVKVEMAIKQGLVKCPWQGDVPKKTVTKVAESALKSKGLSKEKKIFLL